MTRKEFNGILLIIAIISVIMFSYITIALEEKGDIIPDNLVQAEEIQGEVDSEKKEEKGETVEVEVKKVPESVTGLVVGFDVGGGLTDVLMVGHLDTATNQVKIISIPRDLGIDFTKEEFKEIKENNPQNHIAYCKLNEVYSLTGWNEKALQDVREICGIITGLEIDYMARIDVNGFSEIVDSVGGVEFDVPQDMDKDDPYQNLHIHLKKGHQLLDGDKAEQLVRYRDYKMADLQRIQVQQDFIAALSDKVMETRDLASLSLLARSVYDMVETDFGLLDVDDYVEYIAELEVDKVIDPDNMITIPSYGEKVDNIWYQRWSISEARRAVDEIMQ